MSAENNQSPPPERQEDEQKPPIAPFSGGPPEIVLPNQLLNLADVRRPPSELRYKSSRKQEKLRDRHKR
ncbi:MAG: hypothetical protein ACR2LN_03360 [Candidatus Levyibacteriota bacterium]